MKKIPHGLTPGANWEVVPSMVLPSKLVLSWLYQLQDLAFKSPIVVVRKKPFCARVSNMISKLSKVSNRLETGSGKGQ